jgi:DNA-binding transcriptional ArsR family regulator
MSTTKKDRTLDDAELDKVAQQFRVLGEPLRLKILQVICAKPLTVNEIVSATGATQSNVSKHLSLLASAGVIARQKDGQFVYYRLSDPLTMKLCELVHTQLFQRG